MLHCSSCKLDTDIDSLTRTRASGLDNWTTRQPNSNSDDCKRAMLSSMKLGFIGAGQMARAIAFPLFRNGVIKPSQCTTSSPEEDQLVPWREKGCRVTPNNYDVLQESNTIIWATKPQIFPKALQELPQSQSTPSSSRSASAFHISIMAGVSVDSFTAALHTKLDPVTVATARVMPNIAMRVDAGCSVYTLGPAATPEHKSTLVTLLSSVGLAYEVPDSQINAYCGLFASGIGFMFVLLEGLADGGVKMGIARDKSIEIAAQTMLGASKLVLAKDPASPQASHPAVLKDTVCSPGGTTIAGVGELERLGVRYALIRAVEAAAIRGEILGGGDQSGKKSKS